MILTMLLPLGHLFLGDIHKPLSCLQTLDRSLIVVSRGSRGPYLKILHIDKSIDLWLEDIVPKNLSWKWNSKSNLGKTLSLFEDFSLLLVCLHQRFLVPRLEVIPIKWP